MSCLRVIYFIDEGFIRRFHGFQSEAMKTALIILGLFGLVPFINGCAFGTRHATLVYPPAAGMVVVSNTPPRTPLGQVSVGTFSDERPDKVLIGYVRNGYGIQTAEIQLGSGVEPVITDAVRYELKQAGWQVVDPPTGTNSSIPVVSGEILVLHCDAYLSYEGEATLMVHATRSGHEVFKKVYSGRGGGNLNWAATGEGYGRAVSQAVQDAVLGFVRDMPVIIRQE